MKHEGEQMVKVFFNFKVNYYFVLILTAVKDKTISFNLGVWYYLQFSWMKSTLWKQFHFYSWEAPKSITFIVFSLNASHLRLKRT